MDARQEHSLSEAGIAASTRIILRETVVGDVPLLQLRKLREVVIPDGTEKVGNYWFWGSDIESATISASVSEIGVEAFCHCKKLKKLLLRKAIGTKAQN